MHEPRFLAWRGGEAGRDPVVPSLFQCTRSRLPWLCGFVALWLRVLIAVASGDHSESESGRSGNLLMMGSEWEATPPLRGSQSQ